MSDYLKESITLRVMDAIIAAPSRRAHGFSVAKFSPAVVTPGERLAALAATTGV